MKSNTGQEGTTAERGHGLRRGDSRGNVEKGRVWHTLENESR